MDIVFETHATSVNNEHGIGTGCFDCELSDRGRREARELGRRRRDEDVAAVYASDLARAADTAEIAFGGAGLPIRLDRRLRECDYGELNGTPLERFRAEPPRRIDVPYPGGESYRQVVDRVRAFLEDLPCELDGARVLVVGHAATRWALEHLPERAPPDQLVATPFTWRPGWEYRYRRA